MNISRESLLEFKELIEDLLERFDSPEPPTEKEPAPPEKPEPAPPSEGKGRLAIIVGHTRIAPGAFAVAPIGQNEYLWNKELAEMIEGAAKAAGHACAIFFRDGVGVPGAYAKAEVFDPDAVMELHFNAANARARGTETLRGAQAEAAEWAACVQDCMVALYRRVGGHDRGIKKLKSGDRGFQSVSQLETVPSVIIEPFFGDQPDDTRLGQEKKRELAEALARAFDRFMREDTAPEMSASDALVANALRAEPVKKPTRLQLEMGRQIVNFEGRRDREGRLTVYKLPRADAGGTFEVAGINDRYHPEMAARLRSLIAGGKLEEAESEAAAYIVSYTDRVGGWVQHPGCEFYLRDCAFNRGAGGAARILQLATGLPVDGEIGAITREAAAKAAGGNVLGFLKELREARERYEVRYIGRREVFWKGLTNRWNHAFDAAIEFEKKASA